MAGGAYWRLRSVSKKVTNPFYAVDDKIRLFLRASPGASKDEVSGLWRGAEDELRLAVKVSAPPDKGKANEAIVKLLSHALDLPKSAFSVTAGETARLKTIDIKGDGVAIAVKLERLIGD